MNKEYIKVNDTAVVMDENNNIIKSVPVSDNIDDILSLENKIDKLDTKIRFITRNIRNRKNSYYKYPIIILIECVACGFVAKYFFNKYFGIDDIILNNAMIIGGCTLGSICFVKKIIDNNLVISDMETLFKERIDTENELKEGKELLDTLKLEDNYNNLDNTNNISCEVVNIEDRKLVRTLKK